MASEEARALKSQLKAAETAIAAFRKLAKGYDGAWMLRTVVADMQEVLEAYDTAHTDAEPERCSYCDKAAISRHVEDGHYFCAEHEPAGEPVEGV